MSEHIEEAERLGALPVAVDLDSLRIQVIGLQVLLRDLTADLAQAQRSCTELRAEIESKAMSAEQQLSDLRAALQPIVAEMGPLLFDIQVTMELPEDIRLRVEAAAEHLKVASLGAAVKEDLDDFELDEDGYPPPWCRNFEAHTDEHEFCADHQLNWCRICDRECPNCVDDPCCPDCGCHMFEEYHEWDCLYAGDADD